MQTILDNATTVAQMFDAFKKGDVDKLISFMHPRVVWAVSGTAPIPYARTYRGHKDTATFFAELAKAVTFTEFVPERILNADDHTVASIGHFTGTVNATGKETKSDWVMILEFDEEGILVRFKDYVDTQNIANAFQ
jgi:ketosteroid isomerase-like protein